MTDYERGLGRTVKRKKQERTVLYVVVEHGRPALTESGTLVAYGYRSSAVMATARGQDVRRAEIKVLRDR